MYKGHEADSPAELESQFILRLPEDPARALREAIRSNSTLKDRISIKIENDMRSGEVKVDNWLFPAKVMDMPSVIESLKTIDGKGFYKTADICQMLLCKEEEDTPTDEDSPQKQKRKDPNKVEKKYLLPHGITPPAKNIRKRRFRKTLKKKYVEAPEIEKEVKRLLRIDNDAVSVKWEVINEDDEKKVNKGTVIKKEPIEPPSQNVAEHDIFGGAVSSDSEEDAHLNVLELDENSQNSADDSLLTDSNSVMINPANTKLLTEFTSDMFRELPNPANLMQEMDFYQQPPSIDYSEQNLTKNSIFTRLDELQLELADLKMRRQHQEMELDNIDNITLRQRFQTMVERLKQEQIEKEQEKYSLEELLKQNVD